MSPEMGTTVAGRMTAAPPMGEAEPKTLTLEELNYARQAALYVLRTRTAEEAIRIFTDGLKPVRGVREGSSPTTSTTATTDSSEEEDDVELDSSEDCPTTRGGRRGRRRPVKRDVASAPF